MKVKKDSNFFLFLVIVALIGFFSPLVSYAGPADTVVSEFLQPDGSMIKARVKGDEWYNWVETVDGYTIIKGNDDFWYYVLEYVGDKPVLSNVPAHESPPGLEKHIRPDISFIRGQYEAASEQMFNAAAPYGSFSGPVLFILAEFTDVAGTFTEGDFYPLLAGSKSIYDYFNKASHNKVILTKAFESFGTAHNGIVGWVNLGYAHPNPGVDIDNRNQQITRDAILAADPFVDFASYDDNSDGFVDADELAVVVVVAGWSFSNFFGPSVWPHKWSIQSTVGAPTVDGVIVGHYHDGAGGYAQIGEIRQTTSTPSDAHRSTLGSYVHELGHLIFGWPDLYDTDGSSDGIGRFGLMAAGSHGRASTDTWNGETPVLPCAWSKYNRGWVSANTGAGFVNIVPASSNPSNYGEPCYKGPTSLSNEYFLIENRQPSGYDQGLERWLGTAFGGVAIWHIDDNVNDNTNDAHRKVDLEEADGTETAGQATDLWYPGNGNTNFDNTSIPNSHLYNGTSSNVDISGINESGFWMEAALLFVGDCAPPSIPASITYPSSTCVGNSPGDSVEVSWSEVSDASRYIVQRGTDSSFSDAEIVCAPMSSSITTCSNWLEDASDLYYRVCALTYYCGSDGWRKGGMMDVEPVNPIPEYIQYTDISCNGEFEVYWQDSAPGGSYYLERSNYSNFYDAVLLYVGNDPSFLEVGLEDGLYYYRVKAENFCGVSSWRPGGYVLIGTPPTPANLEYPSSDCGGTFRIRWDPYLDSSFTLQRATNPSFSDAIQIYHGSTNWFDETVGEGIYYYRIRAENVCGSSSWAVGGSIDVIDRVGPLLSNPDIDPPAGTTATTFRFTVDYYNSYGDPPNYKRVWILENGSTYGSFTMSLLSGSPENGTYYADVSSLAAGSYSYYFVLDEGYGCYTTFGNFDGPTVTGETYYVPDNQPTIQDALDSSLSGDTIIVRDGTYTGADFKNVSLPDKDIILKSENGPASCIIDCEGSGRGFSFTDTSYPPSTVTLDGFTIINGDVSAMDQKGGGIYIVEVAPTIKNCIIQNCTTGASGEGGGIYIGSSSNPVIIEGVELRGNTANMGGGIHSYYSTLTLSDSILVNNTAYNSGGGILNNSDSNDFNAINCIFSGNVATLRGGALRNIADGSPGTATLTNCVWYENSAEKGGGIYNALTTTELKNAILWNNTASVYGPQIRHRGSQTLTISYSDMMGGTEGVYDTSGTVIWDVGNIDADPLLEDPGTEDLYLQSGSPCIDTGTSAGAPAADMDGVTRPQDGDGLGVGTTGDGSDYDMGPYEYADADADVDGVSDQLDNCPNYPNGSLRGTCTSGNIGQSCMSDTECGGGVNACSMDQEDSYPPQGNNIGDACDCECDFDCSGSVDGGDVGDFLDHFGRSVYFNPCSNQDQCLGDVNCDHNVDGGDVDMFIGDFGRSQYFNPCPACEVGKWCVYP